MSEENIFAIRDRAAEFFRLHNTPVPQPVFGEEAVRFQQRLLSCAQSVLPPTHVWAQQNLSRQPSSALPAIERAILDDTVTRFKEPRGPLREVTEQCPRTGRTTVRFFGDTEECWAPFKCAPRLARFTPGMGRGENSVQAKAAAAAANYETGLAFAALSEKRAAGL
jgi:hypothetical protein